MASDCQSLLSGLQQHLEAVDRNPGQKLDERLLDECCVFLSTDLQQRPQDNVQLVAQISSLSPRLQQDATPLVRLLEKLVETFSFADVLLLQPQVDFAGGLDVEALPYNRIMLQLLRKAAATTNDLGTLANMQPVVKALLKLWLSTPDVGIADTAASVMLCLLEADRELGHVSIHGIGEGANDRGGQGLLWRRIFDDRDIYGMIFDLCGTSSKPKERSLAQARLMSAAPMIGALDWSYLVRSHHSEVERQHGLEPEKEGLLDFIAVHMVDYQKDVLLHINLIQFFTELLTSVKTPSTKTKVSASLQFLQERHVHDKTLSYWLLPDDPSHDPLDLTFLSGPSAQYMSAFASECPDAFLNDQLHLQVLHRLTRALSISAAQWAQGQSPKHDLNVLVSLPRIALLPQSGLGIGRHSTPLLLVPSKNTSADALHTLATVFNGPHNTPPDSRASSAEPATPREDTPRAVIRSELEAEAAAARAVFFVYYVYNDTLFADLVDHASIVALPEKALAALSVISAVASANWSSLPAETAFLDTAPPRNGASLPSESKLQSMRPPTSRVPDTVAECGIEALLQRPAREQVFPFLLRPAQTFTYLVGGRGDPESNAYKVAMGKWDCLQIMQRELIALVGRGRGGDQARVLLSAIDERVREGVWGQQSQAGGQVASLEL